MRCPNGSRKNKDGVCVPNAQVVKQPDCSAKVPLGDWRQNPETLRCVLKDEVQMLKCTAKNADHATVFGKIKCYKKCNPLEGKLRKRTTRRCVKAVVTPETADAIINDPTYVHYPSSLKALRQMAGATDLRLKMAAKLIQKFTRKGLQKKRIDRSKTKFASKRIASFFKKTKDVRQKMFLNAICGEAGVCLAFGIESLKIKEFFGHFDFNLIQSVRRIGNPSSNGFVTALGFEKLGYTSYAVLKSNSLPSPADPNHYGDNLIYEYKVGMFLNKMGLFYPCFLETYGLYKYNNDLDWMTLKSLNPKTEMPPSTFQSLLRPGEALLQHACRADSYHYAVLIQHIRGCVTVKDFLSNSPPSVELLPILFQVYYPLFHMRKNFTHYDLHSSNVVLYEPSPGKYIQYNYETQDGVVSFKSRYLVKIIDYGRSHFNDVSENSQAIYGALCSIPGCREDAEKKCGGHRGFYIDDRFSTDFRVKNESHDVRFMLFLIDRVKALRGEMFDVIKNVRVIYDEPQKPFYGSRERASKGKNVNEIRNVTDVYNFLLDKFGAYRRFEDAYYEQLALFGTINVNVNSPVEFIKSK